MNAAAVFAVSDAGFDRLVQAQEFFSGRGLLNLWTLLAMAGVAALVLAAVALVRRTREPKRSAPVILYHRVAGRLGLTLTQRLLLQRIASRQNLPTPLTLLLSSSTLEHHASAFAQSLPPWRAERLLRRVASIRVHLCSSVSHPPAVADRGVRCKNAGP